ncbi:dystrotelin isoform X2 [Brachyhypopomus gauderio]|uniref:dystrotelin isoform X2 n=1 Tax=Brachyhypopomus gauderio TaxID=698409 RepID=UPI0040412AD6
MPLKHRPATNGQQKTRRGVRYQGLNEIRPAVYRAALKLQSLQKLCHLHVVMLQGLQPILRSMGDSGDPTVRVCPETLRQCLERLFHRAPQELPGWKQQEATEQTARLLFKLYDREEAGFVLLRSVETALVVLSGDALTAKHRALFQLAARCSRGRSLQDRSVTCDGLRVLLDDLSQVPAAVQESHVFGDVETAVQSCFKGVASASVGEDHILRWMQSEHLLLWLSTLHRLSTSADVQHQVRCHACKSFPITGLRYRCVKCVNVHLCQTCFLTERSTRKHKASHLVMEYCTQPSWRETMVSLASRARLSLLPRHYTTREMERSRAFRAASNGSPQHSYIAPSPLQQLCEDVPGGLGVLLPHLPPAPTQMKGESKALQTDEADMHPQRKTSLLQKDLTITQKAMRDLQRDKWLLEREFQVWRAATQSEHESLEDRCTELESTLGVLVQQNQQLEEELGHVRHALSERVTEPGTSIQQCIHTPLLQQDDGDNKSEKQSNCRNLDPQTSSTFKELKGEPVREKDEREERKRKNEEDDEALHLVLEGGHMAEVVTDHFVTHIKEVHLVEEDKGKSFDEWEEPELVRQESITEGEGPELDRQESVTEGEWPELDRQESVTEGEWPELDRQESIIEGEGPELDRQESITEHSCSDGSMKEEDFGPGNSDEEKEQELCDLVQHLKGALLLSPHAESGSSQRAELLQAAGGVGDAVFHLVATFRSLTWSS